MGSIQESESGESIQLITTSTDSYILIWDTRPPKAPTIPLDLAEDEVKTFDIIDIRLRKNCLARDPIVSRHNNLMVKILVEKKQG